MRYDPKLHTLAARERQLEGIAERHPEAFIVGSVGRAAITGSNLPVNKGLFGNEARDIDVTTTNGSIVPLVEADDNPFPSENVLRQLIYSDGISPYATVVFEPQRPDVSVELPAVVFEPYEAKIGNARVKTFHPDTLLRVHQIYNSKRPKDRTSASQFEQELKAVDYPRLPDKYFEPLAELQQMVMNDPELCRQYRNKRILTLYGVYVPAPVRDLLRPIARPLRKAAGIIDKGEQEPPQAVPVPHP